MSNTLFNSWEKQKQKKKKIIKENKNVCAKRVLTKFSFSFL